MQLAIHTSISDIPAAEWDALWPTDYPFTQHAFLHALEASSSIDNTRINNTGWKSFHLTLREGDALILAMPLYLKMHSYGEYVFDWSWANALQQAGINYYPKLVNAIPFTPATGPRVGFAQSLTKENKAQAFEHLLSSLHSLAEEHSLSGVHCLFPEHDLAQQFKPSNFSQRLGYQFHWFNKNYANFEAFLSTFSSRKRKNLKKERNKVNAEKLTIRMRNAHEIPTQEWDAFYALYQRTYLKRSGHGGYLGKDFFHRIAKTMPDQVLLASAHIPHADSGSEQEDTHHSNMVAAALYFRDNDTLYGRYWGTRIELDGLHFECCYYQGIEYAIKHKLKRFDPGAQGEHKIQRGFTPILTQSYHWLRHPGFHGAINNFVKQEATDVKAYIEDARNYMPFKEGVEHSPPDTLL
ncbi:MAG: GNAT family N-acetyltransferase [Agarilytica sp.]